MSEMFGHLLPSWILRQWSLILVFRRDVDAILLNLANILCQMMWHFQKLHHSSTPLSVPQVGGRWVASLSGYSCCAFRWCYSPSPRFFIEHRPTTLPSTPVPLRPPIVQVYSKRWETDNTLPVPISLPSNHTPLDPPENLELPIALRKGTQTCKSTYPIANFVSYDRLSSAARSLIVSRNSISVPKTVKEVLHINLDDQMRCLRKCMHLRKITHGIW